MRQPRRRIALRAPLAPFACNFQYTGHALSHKTRLMPCRRSGQTLRQTPPPPRAMHRWSFAERWSFEDRYRPLDRNSFDDPSAMPRRHRLIASNSTPPIAANDAQVRPIAPRPPLGPAPDQNPNTSQSRRPIAHQSRSQNTGHDWSLSRRLAPVVPGRRERHTRAPTPDAANAA